MDSYHRYTFGDAIAPRIARSTVMSFGIYLLGYIILIIGLAMGAHLARICRHAGSESAS